MSRLTTNKSSKAKFIFTVSVLIVVLYFQHNYSGVSILGMFTGEKPVTSDHDFRIWIFVGAIFIGVGFYVLRESSRIIYGIVEIIFSMYVIRASIIANPTALYTSLDYLNPTIASGNISIFAAIYLFVRGLDNFGNGLKVFPKIERLWFECVTFSFWKLKNDDAANVNETATSDVGDKI